VTVENQHAPLRTAPSARCTKPGSPTCVLPKLFGERRQRLTVADPHTCHDCGRVWRLVTDSSKQRYWRWNGTEYAKPKASKP
jgi:hypothetical protein